MSLKNNNMPKASIWHNTTRYLSALSVLCLLIILAGCGYFSPNTMPAFTEARPDTPAISVAPSKTPGDVESISVQDLPPEGRTTLELIKSGGPFPYSKDGSVFNNFEAILPRKPAGYYHEYTVITPGSPDRGARRIIAGDNGDYYYTEDHYLSFQLIQE
jgi:ribonuclease T1